MAEVTVNTTVVISSTDGVAPNVDQISVTA